MSKWLNKEGGFLFLFVIWTLVISAHFFIFGADSYVQIHDNADSNLPQISAEFTNQYGSSQTGWNHTSLCGYDRYGSIKYLGNIFYWLILLTPNLQSAYVLLMLLQRFIAGYFMFILCRDVLRVKPITAIAAGLLYPLATVPTPFTYFHSLGIPGLPLFILLLERISESDKLYLKVSLALLTGLLIGISNSLTFSLPFSISLIIFWFIFISRSSFRKYALPLLIVFIMAILIKTPQITQLLAVKGESYRIFKSVSIADKFGEIMSAFKLHLSYYLMRDYGVRLGMVSLILGLFAGAGKNRYFRALAAGFIFCVLFSWTPTLIVELIPPLRSAAAGVNLHRYYLLAPFLGVLTTAVSMNFIIAPLAEPHQRGLWPNIVKTGFLALLLSMILLIFAPVLYADLRNLQNEGVKILGFLSSKLELQIAFFLTMIAVIAVSAALYFSLLHRNRAFKVKTPLLIIFPLYVLCAAALELPDFYHNIPVPHHSYKETISHGAAFSSIFDRPEYSSIAKRFTPGDPFRTATAYANRWLHPAYAYSYGLETVDGHAIMFSNRYHLFWKKCIEGVLENNQSLKDYYRRMGHRAYLFHPSYGVNDGDPPPDFFGTYYNLNLLSLSNVRYLFSPFPIDDSRLGLTLKAPEGDLYVYENLDCLPRFFFVHKSVQFDGLEPLLDSLSRADLETIRSAVFVMSNVNLPEAADSLDSVAPGQIEALTYSADHIVLSVNTPANAVLVVTNNWSPYWKAKIDGSSSDIIPVYGAFQGVYVPEGQHLVELNYIRKL